MVHFLEMSVYISGEEKLSILACHCSVEPSSIAVLYVSALLECLCVQRSEEDIRLPETRIYSRNSKPSASGRIAVLFNNFRAISPALKTIL